MSKLILFTLAVGAIVVGLARSPSRAQDNNSLANEHCVPRVIETIPGRFVGKPAAQVVEVERLVKNSPEGPACIFEIGISDATNPYNSRHQIYVWEVHGPGQIFDDGFWHSPKLQFEISVNVIHLQGLAVDQVLVRHIIINNGLRFTHIRLFAFNPANGYSVDLLNIGAAGEITTKLVDGALSINASLQSGQCNACSGNMVLRFDRDSQKLAIQSPAAGNVLLYKYFEKTATAFNN
jgi:hypothetical protein